MADEVAHTKQLEQALTRAGYYPVSHSEGFRIPMTAGDEQLYIHVLPWARGYSVFVSDDPYATSHDWRHVPIHLRHMQHPVYTKRDVVGAHNVPIKATLYAVEDVATQLSDYITVNQAFERRLNERVRRPRPQVRPVRPS